MHAVDISIFAAFFVLNLVVGFIHRGKKQTFKEYAIGNKNFSTAVITATIVATWASGSMFFNGIEQTYSNGLYYILPSIVGSTLGWLISGYIIAPRMGAFLNHVSMADAMSSIYGKWVQLTAAVSAVLVNIGFIAIQFKVISKILSVLFDYQGPEVTIIAASIVIIYSAFGGIRSVSFTDVLQFVTFGTLLPVLALVVWQHISDHQQIIHTLTTNPQFSLKQVVRWSPEFMGSLALMLYLMTPNLPPELFQRMAMARNLNQIKRSITYSAGILLLIELFIAWIAVLLLTDNPNLPTSEVVRHMIDKHTYVGLKGFLGVGVIALAISSADSALNSSAVLIANDILPPLKITKQASVQVATLAVFIIGLVAIILALYIQHILEILLFSANFDMPILTVPIFLTIFGFRTSKRAMYIGMGSGFAVTAFLLVYSHDFNSFVPGMLANMIFLLGSHYLLREKGGWTHWKQPQEEKGLEIYGSYPLTWKERWQTIKGFSIQVYLKESLPNQGYYYPLLAFYLLTASYFSLYNLSNDIQERYLIMYSVVQYSTLMIATSLFGFVLRPTLLEKKDLLAWLWPTIILYTLFFVGGIVVMMSGFESTQVLVFMLNLVMAVLLSSWQLAIALAAIGLTAAVWVFNTFLGDIVPLQHALSIPFQIGYGLLLFSSVLIALFRFKQANQDLANKHEQLRATHQTTIKDLTKSRRHEERFVRALDTEGVEIFQGIINSSKELEEQAKKVDSKLLPASFVENIVHWTEQIDLTTHYLQTLAHRAISYMRLSVETAPIDKVLKDLAALLKIQDTISIPPTKIYNHSKAKELEADLDKIKQLLVSAILYAQEDHPTNSQPIMVWIEDTHLGYLISDEKGQLKEILAVAFVVTTAEKPPKVEPVYIGKTAPDKIVNPQIAAYVNLSTNQHVIEAHYGYMSLTRHDGVTTQLYVIPQYVRDVRPQEIDAPEMDVDAYLPPSNEDYPGAAEQEATFLEAVRTQTGADIAMFSKALRIIKKYHGPAKRKSGEPFYLHPITVATIALGFTKDPDVIIGALLHDLVEDTAFSLPQVGLMFNTRIQRIVDGVTHFYSDLNTLHKIKLATHENINKLLQAEDRSVLYVKLSDRLHNMRTIQFHAKLDKRKQIAEETLLFFVPMAQHLGLKDVEVELQKRSAAVLAALE